MTSADDRIFNNPGPVEVSDSDWTASPEGLRILRTKGVEAWKAWVRDQAQVQGGES